MSRRRGHATGFVLTEALVALAIAAMTVALLTSAIWGLSLTAQRRDAALETSAADWLAARRALIGWAATISATRASESDRVMVGTATTARMYIEPGGAGQATPFVGELRVEARGDADYALIAARYMGLRDARITADRPQETEILRANQPIRLLYLIPQREGTGLTWRYETGSSGDGLPAAIAVEVGNDRMLTARIYATLSASCLARLGPGGLQDSRCALR